MGSRGIEYFGIRHHGPGSARCLEAALDDLCPSMIVIEGPADATPLLPLLADAGMVPPVALLAYETKDAGNALFWPFAEFSPEYRAALWAHRHGIEARFIDLPAAVKLAALSRSGPDSGKDGGEPEGPTPPDPVSSDPLGALAAAAGYEDGESWWSGIIEENPHATPVFPAIGDAMAALREQVPGLSPTEACREAHMRLQIREAADSAEGPVAVVCGAWHVPGLQETHAVKDDKALLKGLPKVPVSITWAPWTEPRLSFASGYGAGIRSPGWYAHLWEERRSGQAATVWLLRAAGLLRKNGHLASTASVIEAERLSRSLAAIRDRPAAGFEELRDAAVASLCFGERALWETIAAEMHSGCRVGQISARTPLSPLMEDLQAQQKKAKLKPEALERELALDLRSESGLFRSTLLHRLGILGVRWGRLVGAGKSRGTFRENWVLRWEPEFAVHLVENLVHGATIEGAAANRLVSRMNEAARLPDLAGLVEDAMTAQLEGAVTGGIELLGERAALTSDCQELLLTLTPMAGVVRYGQARQGLHSHLDELMRHMALEAIVAMPYAVRGLDAAAAGTMGQAICGANDAIRLAEFAPEDLAAWHGALREIVADKAATARIAGLAARLLADAGELSASEAAALLARRLSPGTPLADAADYFEGFFEGAAKRLLFDADLRDAVDAWLQELPEEDLVQNLPLFRRVFSSLDPNERRRLLEAVVRPQGNGRSRFQAAPDPGPWERHFRRVNAWMEKGAPPKP